MIKYELKEGEFKLSEEEKERFKTPTPKINVPFKYKRWYYIIGANFLLTIAILIIMFTFKVHVIFLMLAVALSFPLTGGALIVLGIRLYFDRRKIKKKLYSNVSNNFIIANFFQDSGRIIQEAFILQGGVSHIIRGTELYIVDSDCVFYDEDKRPNIYYKQGIPNPLKFQFNKLIDILQTKIKQGKQGEELLIKEGGEEIDILYSSTNLKQFKKEKFFTELQRSPQQDKIQMALIGLCAALSVVIGIAIIIK